MTAAPAIHATAIILGECGVLICGESHSGKSALARAAIALGRKDGFACLLGDDRIRLQTIGGKLIGRPHPAIAGLIEVRGRGILDAPYEPAAVIHCVIDLTPDDIICATSLRFPEKAHMHSQIGTIVLPRLALPSARPVADNAADLLAYVSGLHGPDATDVKIPLLKIPLANFAVKNKMRAHRSSWTMAGPASPVAESPATAAMPANEDK